MAEKSGMPGGKILQTAAARMPSIECFTMAGDTLVQQFPWRRLACAALLCWAQVAGAAPVAELVVGQSLPLAGESASLGRQLRLGADVLFAHVNATGGIAGMRIRHVVLDDADDPQAVVRNTRQLVQGERAGVLMGYPQAQGVRAVLAQKLLAPVGVALLGPATGAEDLRQPGHPQVFHVRAGLASEAGQLAGHLATLGVERIAMLYAADDPQGEGALDALRAVLARKGRVLAGAAAIGPLPDGTAQAVQALRALKPQAIVLMAPALRAAAFARAWRASGETAHLLGFSRVDHQQVLALAGSAVARGMGFTQVVPYPYAGSSPLAREYRALLAVYGPMDAAPGYAGFEAFIGAKVLVEALQRAGGAGSVAAALEQLGMLDLGGFVVRYGKDERQGSHYVDFTVTGSEGQLLR